MTFSRLMTSGMTCSLILLAPLHVAASAQAEPDSVWRVALERIGAKDYQGAASPLDDIRHRDGFSRAHEANFLFGVVLYRLQRWQEAADALTVAATQVPTLGDYALYYAASAYQALGLKSRALEALSRLLQEHPRSHLAERAQAERARLYVDANLLSQAEEAYKEYLARASDEAGRREARLALAEIAFKEEKRREAEDLLRGLWLKWPGSREAARAGELLTRVAEVPPFTLDEQFERALSLYRSGHYAQAVAAFAPFLPVPDHPRESGDRGSDDSPPRLEHAGTSPGLKHAGTSFASRARLWSGISHFQLRDYSRAIAMLSPLAEARSPLRPVVSTVEPAEALYWIGRSYARLDDREKAITTWARLIHTYPKSPWTDESLYLMALSYSEDGKPKQAVRALSRLLRDHPSSRFADATLWARAWINYRQSALTQALADLRRLHAGAASGSRFRVQALYWQGRVLERLRKQGKALEAYRGLLSTYSDEDYYAEQTRLRLRKLDPSSARFSPRLDHAGTGPPLASPGEGSGFRVQGLAVPLPCTLYPQPCSSEVVKARLLKELNLREEASEEFWDLVGRNASDRGLLYEACSAFIDFGHLEKSVWIAKRLLRPLYAQSRPAEPVPRYWEFLYPLGYWGPVKEQSALHRLDPYLVVALIREESGFAEQVVSRSGAVGLMQLLPTTANELVQAAGRSRNPAKLDSPADNIPLGTRYLALMLGKFEGNWAMALAAYNAGPNQVRRWLERLGHRTDDEFIEEIPFSETQQYVKRVLGSYYRYRAQYGKG